MKLEERHECRLDGSAGIGGRGVLGELEPKAVELFVDAAGVGSDKDWEDVDLLLVVQAQRGLKLEHAVVLDAGPRIDEVLQACLVKQI